MTGGPCALRSRIDQHLGRRWFRTGHNTDAARLKPVGAKRDRRGVQQIELLQTVRPQQPDRLRLPQASEETKHLFEGLVKRLRYLRPVRGSEDSCVEEEVERIDVVIEGLLKVHTIRSDLALCFLQNDLPTELPPALSGRELRAQGSDEE